MGRSNTLKKIVKAKINKHCTNVYYENANTAAMYPHITFYFVSTTFDEAGKQIVYIDIDVWDDGNESVNIDNIVDDITLEFDNSIENYESVLANFFIEDRRVVDDSDKSIRHRVLSIQAQNYEIKEG